MSAGKRLEAWRNLERLLKEIGHGDIFNLEIRDGLPVITQATRMRKCVLLGQPRPNDLANRDGLTSSRFKDLIRYCEQAGSCVIARVVVVDGLPHRLEVEQTVEN